MIDKAIFNPKVETMKQEELQELQLLRLKQTVKNVYEKVPFYRRRFNEAGVGPEDIKKLDDITKFPFTTKDDLRENYPFGLAAVPMSDVKEIHASSGTTGTPTVAIYNGNDIEVWAETMARCLTMSGLTREDVFQITPTFGMFVGGFGFFYGARKIGSAIVPFGSGYSKRQIKLMKDFGTTMLAGIMSYGVRLAEVALKEGIDPARDLKVRKGIFGAEMWTEELKNRLSKLWNMDVYDLYGLTEAGGNGTANDCYLHDGLHTWEDHWLWEIVDPETGVPVEPEEEGEIVFTTLTKQAMPLIRYRTRDVSYWYDTLECDCGRTHHKHAPIKGRTDDMLKVSGVNVWPSTVEPVLLKNELAGMNYQIIVDKVGPVDRLKIVVESREKLEEPEKTALAKNLVSELRQVILQTPEVEIKDPGSLPRVEGKVKRVFDRRPK